MAKKAGSLKILVDEEAGVKTCTFKIHAETFVTTDVADIEDIIKELQEISIQMQPEEV